ncbi:MAG: cytochrome P450 [Burkholderiaceae bacterium]|nr:cytochrome P450 [Burkholderiaceae bacterium]
MSASTDLPAKFDPSDPASFANPYPGLARLREHDPLHFDPHLRAWFVTRYDDNKALTQNLALSSDRLRPFFGSLADDRRRDIASIIRYLSRWMVFTDPPEHTRLRKLASSAFGVRRMNAMGPLIERRVHRLLDGLQGRREIDFIAEFAGPLPALVIMDMLGVPEAELARVKALSDRVALFIGSARLTPDKYAVAEAATRELADYFLGLVAARRGHPTQDLVSDLIAARDPENGDALTDDELVATCILLLFAGHETTTSLLSGGLLALLAFPEQIERLRAQPALAADAVEEFLRYDGPNLSQARVVAEPVELHGKTMKPGERVFLMLAAANRDPAVFERPDELDIACERAPHLAFGWGRHICLGFPLARLEATIAFPALLARWPAITRATDTLDWHASMVFRGVSAMPLQLDWHAGHRGRPHQRQ